MEAWVHREGKVFYQQYAIGVPLENVKEIDTTKITGTTIKFYPDASIFKITTEFDYKTIITRLRQQAYLTKGITIIINDERSGKNYKFFFEGGIKSYVNFLNKNDHTIGAVFYAEKEKNDILVEVSLQYNREYSNNIIPFVNNIHTPEGGTHITGFRTALTRTINKYARDKGILKEKDQNLTNDDVIEGMVAVISIKVIDPQFEGQTKSKLGTAEAR